MEPKAAETISEEKNEVQEEPTFYGMTKQQALKEDKIEGTGFGQRRD